MSAILNQTNDVLFETENQKVENDNVFNVTNVNKSEMADNNAEPSNSDLLSYLKKIDGNICAIDNKLGSLESLEKKVDNFDKELKKS